MTGDYRRNQPEGIENAQVILDSALLRVTRCWTTGGTVTSSRDSVNMVGVGQFVGETVENMCCVSESRQ
jgi:hypothetical protein